MSNFMIRRIRFIWLYF